MIATEEEYRKRYKGAVRGSSLVLGDQRVFTVPGYCEPALLACEEDSSAERLRDFFTQIEYRDLRPMQGHGTHWFDLARMEQEPHASPIRQVPLLYTSGTHAPKDSRRHSRRSATTAGFLDAAGPRVKGSSSGSCSRSAARRAMGALMMHSNEWTLDQAVDYAVAGTPYRLAPEGGKHRVGERQLYLEQPGYGTVISCGKVHIEGKLMSDRTHDSSATIRRPRFLRRFSAAGMILVSMIR